ncbi:substrate-binding domain-containing protein [Novosphingobium cyanobacteriorum]|uniref:Substrate-binding domain-containing protein n=1 Tax=Novosphingobium cyanobacteriorum TaxID=3024215 RepID=A0ABT6CMW4_9SPHN|nr:substrate-binding domain-containing protein [Novosphingobium cyanobacteriorum]MDF8335146.1 substrate-binding domain-containing protein [Novosphingobium cyanobacteriorum]
MISSKNTLMVATAVAAFTGTGAQAQVIFPEAELHGMGASSVAVVLPRELNCVGGFEQVGKNDGTTATVSEGAYPGNDGSFNCAKRTIQKQITGRYISTGSGGGKTALRNIDASSFFDGSAGKIFPSAFGSTWTNPHFIMSDSPLAQSDLDTFNASAVGAKKAGAAIQFPLYVLPVAVAYNPVYGHKVAENKDLSFNVMAPVTVKGTVIGGLRMSKNIYCGIFNGYITNWNDPKIKALNLRKGTRAVSLMDPADDVTRWNSDGVPIRLVGRLDKSGTTDIFTRHLAAVCNSAGMTGPNKYLNPAEALPYNTASGITLTAFRSDAPYKASATNGTAFAGTTNMISGAVWTGSAIDTTNGAETPGLFLLADGSGKVASAINFAPDQASASDANVLLNGKLGYIGADFVRPSAGQTLHAAALEQGNSAATRKPMFLLPTALNATAAFGTSILPPETSKSGAYVKGGALSRSNPLDWYNALYQGSAVLSNPVAGYPITGTTQFDTGTCFASPAVRNALVTFLNASLGNLKVDSANRPLSANIFTGEIAPKLGIKAQMGIAPLPKAWTIAITETFLKRSKQKSGSQLLGTRSLYIQNGLPTATGLGNGKKKLALADLPTEASFVKGANTIYNEAGPNPGCTAGSGL